MQVSDFIGIPFQEHGRTRGGCDCWGLVRLYYADVLNLTLPSLAAGYSDTKNVQAMSAVIDEEARHWREIAAGAERQGDVIVLRMRGAPVHVGVVLSGGRMLHIEEGVNSCVEKYISSKWAKRVEKFYRYSAAV